MGTTIMDEAQDKMEVNPDGSINANTSSATQTTFTTGAKSSIGTTAVQMTTSSVPVSFGVLVKAATANSGRVYVGSSDAVTNGSADATDGFELKSGEGILLEVDNANRLYVIASASGQKVFWVGI